MIMPIIIPHIAASGVGQVTAEGLAASFAFGSILALKALVCLMIVSIPIGAVFGWLQDGPFLSFAVALMAPMVVAMTWGFLVAVAQGLLWVIA